MNELSKDLRNAIKDAAAVRAAYMDLRARYDCLTDEELKAERTVHVGHCGRHQCEVCGAIKADLAGCRERRADARLKLTAVAKDYQAAMQVAIDLFARDYLPMPESLRK